MKLILLILFTFAVSNSFAQSANVFFNSNSDVLRVNDVFKLMEVFEDYEKKPFRLKLVGHADTVGSVSYNLSLSKRRVNAVRNFLIKKGWKPSDIEIEFVGELAATKDDQLYNRRVEINRVNENQVFNNYNEFISYMSPKMEKFEVSANKNTVIEGQKGTVIRMPAGVFQYSNGLPADGNISILLQEYYSKADCISSGLSTISDGNLLKTGGMINIKAVKDTAELVLKDSASIEVGFPRSSEERFYTFYGDTLADGRMNWQLDEVLWKQKQEDIGVYISTEGQLVVAERTIAEEKSRNLVYETITGKFMQMTAEEKK